jgi:hypothetical protein
MPCCPPWIEPRSPLLQTDSLPSELPGKPHFLPQIRSNSYASMV